MVADGSSRTPQTNPFLLPLFIRAGLKTTARTAVRETGTSQKSWGPIVGAPLDVRALYRAPYWVPIMPRDALSVRRCDFFQSIGSGKSISVSCQSEPNIRFFFFTFDCFFI